MEMKLLAVEASSHHQRAELNLKYFSFNSQTTTLKTFYKIIFILN